MRSVIFEGIEERVAEIQEAENRKPEPAVQQSAQVSDGLPPLIPFKEAPVQTLGMIIGWHKEKRRWIAVEPFVRCQATCPNATCAIACGHPLICDPLFWMPLHRQ